MRIRHVHALNLADGVPFQFEDRHIVIDTVPDARDADFSTIGPNEWLVETAPFTHAEFSFFADAAGAEAQHLGVASGAPVFVGTRVPLQNLIDYLAAGDSLEKFLDAFPSVTREQAAAALELAGDALAELARSH